MGDLLESLVAVIVVVVAIVGAVNKANKKKGKSTATPQTPQTPRPSPAAPDLTEGAAPKPAAAQMRQGAPVLPSKKPPRRTAPAAGKAGSLAYASPEGKEVHAPGFHGEKPPLLAMLDLNELDEIRAAARAQTAHTVEQDAANPVSIAQPAPHPRYSAAQLREAFVMKEILDAPVSRRAGGRMPYGRR